MVAPLIAAAASAAPGLGARALGELGLDSVGGVIGGLAGSFIPGIIDALTSSKSKEEAAQALAPMRQSKIAELVGRGVRRDEASAQVDEEMQSAVQEEMQKGSLPAWAEMALGLVGGIAGAKLGSKLGKKPMPKADAPAPAVSKDAALDLKAPFTPRAKGGDRPMEMPPGDRPGEGRGPLDRGGMDDGMTPAAHDISPERGLVSPFGGRAAGPSPKPKRRYETDEARDAEFEVIHQGSGQPRLGHTPRPDAPMEMGMEPRSMPMSEAELLVREGSQSARRRPRQMATSRQQPRLGYEEPYRPDARMRNPITGVPDEPIGFDPLTGAPIY